MVNTVGGIAASTASKSATSVEKLTKDFDKFLTLLTTQLKNQDPLDPVDTAEFTNQLVQFASVEQLIQQNSNMEAFIKNQEFGIASNAVNYVGRTVEVPSSLSTLSNDQAMWNYTLTKPATSVFLHVVDPETNEVLRSFRANNNNAGTHPFVWNGKDAKGNQMDAGDYRLLVEATGQDGKRMPSGIKGFGQVTAVELDGNEPAVVVLGWVIPISDVSSVSGTAVAPAPAPAAPAPAAPAPAAPAPAAPAPAAPAAPAPAAPAPAAPAPAAPAAPAPAGP